MRDRRVLLTGAAGFLGANLTRELLRRGADVHVLLRATTDPWRIAELRDRISVHRADLTDAGAVRAAVAAARPRLLFHLAMPSGHPQDRDARAQMVEGCVRASVHVLEAALAHGVERLVQLASFLEYGPSVAPVPETAELRPATLRGAAKAAATLWSQGFARATRLSSVVLRAFSVYGPWEPAGRLVPSAVKAALDGSPLPLTPFPSCRDFVYVDDVVNACLLAADAHVPPGEAFNVGSGVLSSSADVVAAVEAACERRLRIEGEYPAVPADSNACAASLEKVEAALGWRPRHSLRQGIEATVAWFRERRGRPDLVQRRQLLAGEAHGQP